MCNGEHMRLQRIEKQTLPSLRVRVWARGDGDDDDDDRGHSFGPL